MRKLVIKVPNICMNGNKEKSCPFLMGDFNPQNWRCGLFNKPLRGIIYRKGLTPQETDEHFIYPCDECYTDFKGDEKWN